MAGAQPPAAATGAVDDCCSWPGKEALTAYEREAVGVVSRALELYPDGQLCLVPSPPSPPPPRVLALAATENRAQVLMRVAGCWLVVVVLVLLRDRPSTVGRTARPSWRC